MISIASRMLIILFSSPWHFFSQQDCSAARLRFSIPCLAAAILDYASPWRLVAALFLRNSYHGSAIPSQLQSTLCPRSPTPSQALALHIFSLPLPIIATLCLCSAILSCAFAFRFCSGAVRFSLSSAVPLQYSADLCTSVAFPGQAPHCPALALLFFAPPSLCCSSAVLRLSMPPQFFASLCRCEAGLLSANAIPSSSFPWRLTAVLIFSDATLFCSPRCRRLTSQCCSVADLSCSAAILFSSAPCPCIA